MCGIFGVIDLDGDVDQEIVDRIIDGMSYRGPDDRGVWIEGPVCLAHRRLSILDVSPAGRNPMASVSRRTRIVHNGEIYNFRRHRQRLEREGIEFRSETDTEVILALYERHGLKLLEQLRGMFAFGLWDAAQRQLLLARDRFGEKPLYYYLTQRRLIFASEIGAITGYPGIPREVSPLDLDTYLTLGYVPAPRTIYRHVRKLPAGHRLVVRVGEDGLRSEGPEAYFRLDVQPDGRRSREDTVAEARHLLQEAIRLCLVADVPVGAFLSGGVDSSAIVGIMSHVFDHPVKTFSVGFEEERYDELRHARQIAKRFGTDHHEIVFTPSLAAQVLDGAVEAMREPFADPSALNNFIVSRLARTEVKVAIAGDGGDEAFAGYERYTREATRNPMTAAPAPIRATAGWLARRVPEWMSARYGQIRRIQHALDRSARDNVGRYVARLFIFSREERRSLYRRCFLESVREHDALADYPPVTPPQDHDDEILFYQWADLHTYIPEDLMLKADRMSMWHSLEVRNPFLDHELLRFAMTVPSEMNVVRRERKAVLKEAMSDVIPKDVMYREKRGFALPYGNWMRGPWRTRVERVLRDPDAWIYNWVRTDFVERLLETQARNAFGADWRLWNLLTLELWAQTQQT